MRNLIFVFILAITLQAGAESQARAESQPDARVQPKGPVDNTIAKSSDANIAAGEPYTREEPATWPPVGPAANSKITKGELALNFGIVYVADWGFYLATQNATIHNDGSFQNWATNWYQPHFDNDSFEYNIFKHTLVGQMYYQFYRSRGYEVKRAFVWSFASSLAFELFIETVTERPSFQDIYQTPVYGAILGIGLEKISQACHRSGTFLGHACGFLFDPFTLLPNTPKFALYPDVSKDRYVANVVWEW